MSEITKLEKKLADEELMASLRACDKKELEFRLLQLAKHAEEITTTRNNDQTLNECADELKELKAPYTEQMKGVKLKARIIHLLLKEMGE